MNKILLTLSTIIFSLVVLIFAVSASATKLDTIKICHATGSNSHPYVTNNPAATGDVSGHDGHNGGVYPTNPWGDIIPPFNLNGVSYPGKNWTSEGQAIYNNGCKVADETDKHLACSQNSCVLVEGAGDNTCESDSDCATPTPTPGPEQHYACQENACTLVNGNGDNTCQSNDDCQPEVTPTPTETPSNPGGGSDNRSDNLGCSTHDCSNQSHPTQAVLGLSTTSGANTSTQLIQIFAAFIVSLIGFRLIKNA